MARVQSFISLDHTATDDTKFSLTSCNMWFREINIECQTNNAKYGDLNKQDNTINAGDIISYQYINLRDIFFINAAAGSNTVIVASGSLLLPFELKQYGLEE